MQDAYALGRALLLVAAALGHAAAQANRPLYQRSSTSSLSSSSSSQPDFLVTGGPVASDEQRQGPAGCQLPPTWMGRWYQANKEPIRVTSTEMSDKGLCRDNKGDRYLFESAKQHQHQPPCLVCLVINERHLNVLQYKESSCQPVPASYLNATNNGLALAADDHSLLDAVCSDITGDAQLESLFRLDTPPIECPIQAKYHFTYDNCREPLSSLDSCIDKKQLNFRFAACPDVAGSESKCKLQLHLCGRAHFVCAGPAKAGGLTHQSRPTN